jgi:hypothetical protein
MSTLSLHPDRQSPDQVLTSLLELMDRVSASYQKGISLLRAGDVRGFRDQQMVATQLSREYEIEVKGITVRGGAIKSANPSLREEVLARQESLAKVADEYQYLCLRMAESAKRVQDRLLNAARKAIQQEQSAYSAHGTLESVASTKPIATSINSSF